MSDPARNQRIDMRLSADHKELIERAAALTGQPLSRFAVATLVEHAQEVITRHEQTSLSQRDWSAFLHILDETEPNAALVDLMSGDEGA